MAEDKYTSKHSGNTIDRAIDKALSIPVEAATENGLYYTDVNGNVALKYTPDGGFDVAKISGHLRGMLAVPVEAVVENGLYYADINGNIALKYTQEGLDVAKISDHMISLIGDNQYEDLQETLYDI